MISAQAPPSPRGTRTARLAAGDAPRAAIEGAKVYLDAALRASASLNIGRGAHGPLHHGFRHSAWPA